MDTIKKMEELFLNIRNRLPYSLYLIAFDNYFYLKDDNDRRYRLIPLNEQEYKMYYSLYKSNNVVKPIYELFHNNTYYLLFYEVINRGEERLEYKKIKELLISLFKEYKYPITINHSHSKTLTNLYKVLDNKFVYFEIRIREIETKPIKEDLDWIILSKYHIILDSKLYLYDLQGDLFKLIDKNEEVEYGVIYKYICRDILYTDKLYPSSKLYYGPLGVLYSRIYISFNKYIDIQDLKKEIDKLSNFNKKYFLFMVLYIYIININFDIFINKNNISSYMLITKEISQLLKAFKDYAK